MMKKIIIAISIFLMAKFACSEDLYWHVNQYAFENSMSVVATIYIDDVEQQNEMFEIGVFCDEELRGSALPHISTITDKYVYSLTIYGHEEGESLTFKFYDHAANAVSELVCRQTLDFSINGIVGNANTPYAVVFSNIFIFTGSGSWNDPYNWSNSKVPVSTDDAIIDGEASISDVVTINSLIINEGKTLTIENGGVLTVTTSFTNDDVDALIIEEGGQIFHTNDNVAATFRNEIVVPDGVWGEPDETGWQFVSSPMQNTPLTDFVPQTGDYDLFRYEATLDYEWYNLKKSITYDFSDNAEGWTTKDADGDGHDWILADNYIYSESYDIDNDEELSPDNYLIFPLMNPKLDGEYLRFMARAEDDSYPEKCGVAVSEDGENFNMIENASWTVGEGIDEGEPSQWYEKVVNLSAYKDRDIYVAIRHYETVGSYNLHIKDVKFYRDGGAFENGTAYLVSYETESVACFKGMLNKEDSYKMTANYSADGGTKNYNLFGNPFPYNIDWATDVKLAGINAGFAVVKPDGAFEYKTGGTLKTGEGFMINSAKGRTHTITLQKGINASKREVTKSVNVIAKNHSGSDNVIICFGQNEELRFAKLDNFNRKIADVSVRENDTIYGIYNYDQNVDEIKLRFHAKEMGIYSLTFEVEGEFENLCLIDKMTGEKVNLLLDDEYEFMADPDDDRERFVLRLDNGQQMTDNANFAYINDDGELVVTDLSGDAEINIYDVLGRRISSYDAKRSISTRGYETGVYILQKIDDNGVRTQKIVIE